MGQPVSDAAFELLGACVHSLRFSFGAPLDYPYAPALLAEDNPPPALFRRVQAASPPPAREGDRWQTGLTIDGTPFDPQQHFTRLGDVQTPEGARPLDLPQPDEIVLDLLFRVPRQQQTMTFPGDDRGKYLLSVPYWKPPADSGDAATRQVEYFATHRLQWTKQPQDPWVALSFDAFWPAERDSADVIIRLGDCDDGCPAT